MKPENKQSKNKQFKVAIVETLVRYVYVDASELKEPTEQEAEQLVSDRWHNAEYILEADDFSGVTIKTLEVLEGGDDHE